MPETQTRFCDECKQYVPILNEKGLPNFVGPARVLVYGENCCRRCNYELRKRMYKNTGGRKPEGDPAIDYLKCERRPQKDYFTGLPYSKEEEEAYYMGL